MIEIINVTRKVLQVLTSKQRTFVVLLIFLMLLGGIMESISVSLILPLITAITDADNWDTTAYARIVCDIFKIDNQTVYIEVLIALLIGIFIFKNIYLLLEYYIQFSFTAKSRYQLQQSLMEAFINKDYDYYLNASTGEIIRIIGADCSHAFNILNNLLTFYTEGIVSVILGITIFAMSPVIAIELFFVLLLELFFVSYFIKPVMRRIGNRQRDENALSNKWMLQSINGIKSIKVAHKESFFCDKFSRHSLVIVDTDRKNQTLSNVPKLLIESLTVTAVLLIMLISLENGADLNKLVPQLSAFVVAAVRLLPSTNRISVAMNTIPYFEGGLDNVLQTLKEEGIRNINQGVALNETLDDVKKNFCFNDKITIDHLIFSYPGSRVNVLNEVTFEITRGQSVGIIGNSGEGKTTVVDLMLGLLNPVSGRIMVDGIDINTNLEGWLSKLAYIPQQIFLMDDTIRDNVVFGEKPDDDEVWRALEEAQMSEYVRSLPEGIDTRVGEQGIRLSGGQRQRIGIARALYSNPDILFFDEATSALDSITEQAIMESINHLKGIKTMIIIAHRLSTISKCDIVYKVDNGHVYRVDECEVSAT